MKIAIYHPDLSNFGGGEAVAITIANILGEKNDVDIFTPFKVNKKELGNYFKIDLSKINIIRKNIIFHLLPFPKTVKPYLYLSSLYSTLNKYDLVIDTCTNGHFSKKLKPKTICYIHFPFFYQRKKGIKSILNFFIAQPKDSFVYNKIIVNSNFTKSMVKKLAKGNIEVINPPVNIDNFKLENIKSLSKIKKNQILSIGRFTYEKKHKVLIDTFKKIYKKNKNISLHLVGTFRKRVPLYSTEYLKSLKVASKGYPIFFHVNASYSELVKLVQESKIYWHSRGYGENNPLEYENFGITTVEAMAAGCIPIVINKGAQPEIVNHKVNGFVWKNTNDLQKFTELAIKNKKLAKAAIKKSKKYRVDSFTRKFLDIVQ